MSPSALSCNRPSLDLNKVLAQRTDKRLDGYAYKLGPESNQYGLDTVLSDDMLIDEKNMCVNLLFADGNRRDGVGDLLEVGGIRTDRHRLNPLVLFDHGKAVQLPIALAENRNTKEYTVAIDPVARTARCQAWFYQGTGVPSVDRQREYDHALFCEQLFHLIAQRFIRGGSIGYQTVKALPLRPEYTDWQPAQEGLHLLVTLMLEASAVILPANSDTVAKMLAMPKVCGKSLSPYLVKSFAPYAPERKAQLGYETKADDEEPEPKEPKPAQTASEEHKPPAQERARRGRTGSTMRQGNNEAFSINTPPFSMGDPSEGLKGLRLKYRRKEFDKFPYGKIEDDKSITPGREVTNYQLRQRIHKPGCKCSRCNHRGKYMGTKAQPSDDISPEKARQILKDGEANGKPLTDKQRGLFGAAAGREKTLSGVTPSAFNKDVPALRAEAVQLLKQYLDTDFEGYRERAWDTLLESGYNLGNIPRTRAGAQYIVSHFSQLGAKSMKVNTKASPAAGGGSSLPEDGGVHAEPDGDEGKGLEPYGAQVIRSLHEDHSILMQEYDEMLQVVEHPKVKKLMEKLLQAIEGTLTACEEIFGSEYGELGGLEDKEMAMAAEGEKPTPEEAVEGMQNKRLLTLARNTLRRHYKTLGDGSKTVKNFLSSETSEVEVTKPAGPVSYAPGKEPMQQHTESVVPGGAHGTKGVGTGKFDQPGTNMGIEGEHTPGTEAQSGSELTIHPYENIYMKGAKDFLGEFGGAKEFNQEFAFKAYHFHKLLNPIQERLKQAFKGFPEMEKEDEEAGVKGKNFVGTETSEVETVKPGGPSQYTPGNEPMQQHTESVVPGGVHGGKALAYQLYKTLGDVSAFLKDVSSNTGYLQQPGYDEDQSLRGKSLALADSLGKSIDAISWAIGVVNVTKPAAQNPCAALNSEPMQQHTESVVPGGTGAKALQDMFQQQSLEMEAIRAQLATLVNW